MTTSPRKGLRRRGGDDLTATRGLRRRGGDARTATRDCGGGNGQISVLSGAGG